MLPCLGTVTPQAVGARGCPQGGLSFLRSSAHLCPVPLAGLKGLRAVPRCPGWSELVGCW